MEKKVIVQKKKKSRVVWMLLVWGFKVDVNLHLMGRPMKFLFRLLDNESLCYLDGPAHEVYSRTGLAHCAQRV